MAQQECAQHLQQQREVLGENALLEEFTGEQRERLARLRRLVDRGERSDAFPVDKRQDFIRWLIDQGKLSEN